MGIIDFLIPISSGEYWVFKADVFNLNIPLLLRLDILDRCKLVINIFRTNCRVLNEFGQYLRLES